MTAQVTLPFDNDVALAPHTTLQVGGPARHWLEVSTLQELQHALRWAREEGTPLWLLGGGSNVLVADAGLPGLVLRVRNAERNIVQATFKQGGELLLEVGAGHDWDSLVAYTVEQNWAGLECLSGIPGNAGAAPMQNVGAYGQEVSQTIEQVLVVARDSGEPTVMTAEQCAFGYRDSIFKHEAADRYVVWSVRFRLKAGGAPLIAYPELQRAIDKQRSGEAPADGKPNKNSEQHAEAREHDNEQQTKGREDHNEPSLQEVRDTVIRLRRRKSMVLDTTDPNHRSAGSFFVNPILSPQQVADVERLATPLLSAGEKMPRYPASKGRIKLPAAWLIERAGMHKGYGDGPAGLSQNHTLAVVNRGQASAAEIVAFASHVRRRVFDRFGVTLWHEPRLLGFDPQDVAGLTESLQP